MLPNIKQEQFCQQYVIDLNGTKAAIRAGYSKRTANEQASRLLANVNIKERIAQLQAEIAERNQLKADDIIQELRALAFWNIKDFLKPSNVIKDMTKVKRDVSKPVVGIKTKETRLTVGGATTTEVTTELKLADKRAALVDLGRHIGIFEKDNNQKKIKIKVTRK